MKNRIKISDFVKLTGSTLKTIIYYHKIGLLQEPERSPAGYRLYGSTELTRMQLIKRLKSLGLNLKHIKDILGDIHNPKTLQEALQSLRVELIIEKKAIEERVAKIDKLLSEETVFLDENTFGSSSFQMITKIIGQDQIDKYARTCPEIFERQRKSFGILDDFKWGEEYHENFQALAEYFRAHPDQYQIALEFGVRLAKVAQLPEDDPDIEVLARESAEYIKSIPQLKKMLCNQPGIKKPLKSLYNEAIADVLPPTQIKFKQFLEEYLNLQS